MSGASRGPRLWRGWPLSDPAPWRIEVRPAALKALKRLGRKDQERIQIGIGALPEGDVKRLRGPDRLWRLRVGEWRIIFTRRDTDRVLDVRAIRPRGRAYRR
ncbi:MAG: type II toxin-antitoxin system RelE/ParE family toxin [Solirubrobacterales bacterium]|nr:type II toxin-antitoxin system RelE/ParE family toxin [Solirubrobacterales bacterium]